MSNVQTEALYWGQVPVFYVAEPGDFAEKEVGDAIRSLMDTRPEAIESLPRAGCKVALFKTGPGGEKFAGVFARGEPIVTREREGVLAEAGSDEPTKVLLERVADFIEAWAADTPVADTLFTENRACPFCELGLDKCSDDGSRGQRLGANRHGP